MVQKTRSRFVGVLTIVSLFLLIANLVGGWFLFFTYGARPDGVVPAFVQWLGAMWILGPLVSVCSLAVAFVGRSRPRQRWMNAGVCAAYVFLWAFVLLAM